MLYTYKYIFCNDSLSRDIRGFFDRPHFYVVLHTFIQLLVLHRLYYDSKTCSGKRVQKMASLKHFVNNLSLDQIYLCLLALLCCFICVTHRAVKPHLQEYMALLCRSFLCSSSSSSVSYDWKHQFTAKVSY
jgi:hypothetical protein